MHICSTGKIFNKYRLWFSVNMQGYFPFEKNISKLAMEISFSTWNMKGYFPVAKCIS
jgi:hypothetical protein